MCDNSPNTNAEMFVDEIENIQSSKGEDKVDLEKELIIPLIATSPIYAYHSTEYVKDIGTPDRLEKVTADYVNGVCEQRDLKHKQKCIFLLKAKRGSDQSC